MKSGENILRKGFFHKNGQKSIFYFERWKFAEKGTVPGPPNGGALGGVLKLSKIRCARRAARASHADLIIR